MEKGILSSALESKLAEKLDELVKLNGVLEAVDGVAFKIVITAIDNNAAEKIPEPYKTQIAEMLVDILEDQDYQSAAIKASELVNSLVDIPGLDDPTEAMIFAGIFTVVAGLLAKIGTDGNK